MFDKFHEECGVVAVYGHPEAANLAYLGLYALAAPRTGKRRHRHQRRHARSICYKAMGHVADIFTPGARPPCRASMAIGHTRYSTAGDTALNAQPFSVDCNKGRIAVAHNGNITNAASCAASWKAAAPSSRLKRHRSDSAPGGALPRAHPGCRAARGAAAAGRRLLAGVSGRRPRRSWRATRNGFRPLAMGEMELSGGRPCYVFASETCAFDLIGATYVRDVEPGEMVIVGPEGWRASATCRPATRRSAFSSTSIFRAPIRMVFGRLGAAVPRDDWAACWRANARRAGRRGGAGAGLRRRGGPRLLRRIRHSVPPSALIRNHYVGRTFIEPSQADPRFRREAQAQPGAPSAGRQARGAGGRFHRARHHQPKIVRMVRSAGAREVHVRISCPPTVSPCFYGVDTPTRNELIASQPHRGRDPPVHRGRHAGLSFVGRPEEICGRPRQLLLRLLHRRLPHRPGNHQRTDSRQWSDEIGIHTGNRRLPRAQKTDPDSAVPHRSRGS